MSADWSHYYKINYNLLLSAGLWPCQYPALSRIHITFSYAIMATLMLVQLFALITFEYDLNLVLKVLSTSFPCTITIIKYVTYHVKHQDMKIIMEKMDDNWNAVKNEKTALQIMQRYANNGRLCTLALASEACIENYMKLHKHQSLLEHCLRILFYWGITTIIAIQLVSPILDLFVPLNESRPRHIIAVAEYFVDQQRYFYLIILHISLAIIFVFSTILSTETIFMVYVQHACSMFKIACYRFENIMEDIPRKIPDAEKHVRICNRMITAINLHRRAIEFTEFIWSTYSLSYFLLAVLGVASLSINLFRFFQAMVIINEFKELSLSALLVVTHFGYLFLTNLFGQRLMDHSSEVFRRVYNSRWYEAPIKLQKLYLFIMQATAKYSFLDIRGLFIASLEGFTTLTSTSVSYFMLLHSLREETSVS